LADRYAQNESVSCTKDALICALAKENDGDRVEENLQVEHQPLVFNLMTVGSDPLIGTTATKRAGRGTRYYGCGVVADLPIGAKPTGARVGGPATTDAV